MVDNSLSSDSKHHLTTKINYNIVSEIVSDKEISEKQVFDIEVSDEEVSNNEVSDNKLLMMEETRMEKNINVKEGNEQLLRNGDEEDNESHVSSSSVESETDEDGDLASSECGDEPLKKSTTEKHVTVMRSASPDFDSPENKSDSDSESDSESEKIQNIDNISEKLVSGISCAFDDDDKDDFTPPYVDFSCISDESRDVDENVEKMSNQGMIKDDSEYSKARKRTSNTELCSSAKRSKSSSPVDCQIDLLLCGDVEDSNSEFPEQDAGLVPDEESKKALVVTKSTVSSTEFAEKQDKNIYSQSLFSQDAFNQTQGSQQATQKRSGRLSSVLERIKAKKLEVKEESEEMFNSLLSCTTTSGLKPASESSLSLETDSDTRLDIDLLLNQRSDIIAELEKLFSVETSAVKIQRIQSWQEELKKLSSDNSLPETLIAVVGTTGAGKSSLMNALLDHANILPTSGMKACTAVVVQISDNRKNKDYEAEIEFLSEKEWMDEVEILLKEYSKKDNSDQQKNGDDSMEYNIAKSKLRAVYGKLKKNVTLKQLSLQRSVTRWLGKTRPIGRQSLVEFKKEIDRYIESKDNPQGGEFWPIVKHVKIRIPNCSVCSNGAVLVDLPGVGDSNAARNKIAKENLKNCHAVWVVSDINRAVHDKTAKDLLGEQFRRQLVMDGQYGSVSFICTKTDHLNPSEIIGALKIEDECEELESSIALLEVKIHENESALETNVKDVKLLQAKIDKCKDELADGEDDLMELTQVAQDEKPNSEDIEYAEVCQHLNSKLSSTTQYLKESEEQLEQKLEAGKELEKEKVELEAEIFQCRKGLRELCAKERNKYSKRAIRKDFEAGMKEVKVQSGVAAIGDDQDDDVDDDDEDESDDDDEVEQRDEDIKQTAENLKVFCVSSTEYLKLRRKLSKDGPAQIFSDVEATGIPELMRHVHVITNNRRFHSMERMVKDLGQFVSNTISYLCDSGSEDLKTRDSLEVKCREHFLKLENEISSIIDDVSIQKFDDMINNSLKPNVSDGVMQATNMAAGTVAKWGSKPEKENRQAGGLPFSVYKATTRRYGVYNSPTHGAKDFNEDLARPMYASITVAWDKIFNYQISSILDNFKSQILAAVLKFSKDLHSELLQCSVSSTSLARIHQQLISTSHNKLISSVKELKDFVTVKQRGINRFVTPAVMTSMTPAYDYCNDESGPGCFDRMKRHMSSHVELTKKSMFDETSQKIFDQLVILQKDIKVRLSTSCRELMLAIQSFYEPVWGTPVDNVGFRKKIINDILKVKDKLFKLFEIAGLDTNADELKILNHPPEIAGSHPPEKAGSCPPEMAGWRPPEMAGSRPLNKPSVQNITSQALTSDNKSVFKLQPTASVQRFLGSASQTILSSPMSAAHTSTGIKQEKLSPTGSLLSSGSIIPSGSLPHRQLSNFHSEVKLEPGIGKLAIPNPHQRDLHLDVTCKIKQEPSIVTEFYDPQTGRKRKQPSPDGAVVDLTYSSSDDEDVESIKRAKKF